MSEPAQPMHASLIAYQGMGILITGPSGSFKTTLAIEAMQLGAKFIADDRVQFTLISGMLMGGPPKGMQGVLEIRGVGLFRLPDTATQQVIHCVIDLSDPQSIERLPATQLKTEILGISVPMMRMAPPPHTSAAVMLSAVKWMVEGRLLPSDWRPPV